MYQIEMCRNHPQNRTEFYMVEEPWIKLCKECALNLALCGRKIDKMFTPDEFQSKIALTTVVEGLRKVMGECEKEGKHFGELCDKMEKTYQQHVSSSIKAIDQHLEELNRLRNELSELYEQHISRRMNSFHDSQNKLILDVVVLRKHLESIETNYCDILTERKKEPEIFQRTVELMKVDLENAKKNLERQKEKRQKVELPDIKQIFTHKIQYIKKKAQSLNEDQEYRVSLSHISCKLRGQSKKYLSHRKNQNSQGDENKVPTTMRNSQATTRTHLSLRSTSKKVNKPARDVSDISNFP